MARGKITNIDFDPRLKGPFSCIISGPSGCGKSHLVDRFLSDVNNLVTPPVKKIFYHYGEWQPLFGKMQKEYGVEFREGLPTKEDLAGGGEEEEEKEEEEVVSADLRPPHTLLILDDLMSSSNQQVVADIFTKYSHHRNMSVIYITQNLFQKSPEFRTMSLNAHYMIIFKNPRDMGQISALSRQVFPSRAKALTAIFTRELKRPHSYVLLDFKQTTPDDLRIRSSLTSLDDQFVFLPLDKRKKK